MSRYKLIEKLAQNISTYTDYEILENTDESDPFPYVVKLSVRDAERYLGKPFFYILHVNESRDGLVYYHEDTEIEVDHDGWIYLGYSDALSQKILFLEHGRK